MPTPEIYELFKAEEVAYDIAKKLGYTETTGINDGLRYLNQAGLYLAGIDRKWSWLKKRDTLQTIANEEEYSLNDDVKEVLTFNLTGSNKQKLERIPTLDFIEAEPVPTDTTGVPRWYDELGVDSSGNKVYTFFPVPDSAMTIRYWYYRELLPIMDGGVDIRSYWGVPRALRGLLVDIGTMFGWEDQDDNRYPAKKLDVDASIANAFAADQARPDTKYRARDQAGVYDDGGGPRLPPQFGG